MKKNLSVAARLTLVLIILCAVIYPLSVALLARLSPGAGSGVQLTQDGRVVGYELIGQDFRSDRYFHGRPSAVSYNSAGSGGSNKSPLNPDYLQIVRDRIDSFLVHNPGISRNEIPAELVTSSGSGLDPHLSPAAARIQIARIAKARGLSVREINDVVNDNIEDPVVGPVVVNVLKLNIALNQLQK